jgi:hypothetical protein
MLRRQTAIVCLLLPALNQSSLAQSWVPPQTVVIQKGVVLKFATVAELSSETAKKGDRVPLVLTRPLVIDGITLLPVGTQAYGRVTKAKKAGPKCGAGFFEWEVDRVRFADATSALTEIHNFQWRSRDAPIPESINSSEVQRGRHDDLKALPQVIVLAPFAAPFLAAYLISDLFHRQDTSCAGKGTDQVYPAGSTVGVVVAKTHRVRY